MRFCAAALASVFLASGIARADGTLLVLNKSEANVSLLDARSGAVVATVPVGLAPHEVAVSPDGRTAVVSNYGVRGNDGRTLTVLDVAGARAVRTIDLGELRRPHGVAFLPDGATVAVTAEANRAVALVDVASGRVLRTYATGAETSHMLAVSPDGARIFVASIGSGSVTSIDVATGSVRSAATGAGAEGIAISPDGAEVWVTNRAADTVSVLDSATLEVRATLASPSFPIRIAFTRDGRRVLVSRARSGDVAVIDRATRKEIGRIPMSAKAGDPSGRLFSGMFGASPAPVGILVPPSGTSVFVANSNADVVAVLDLARLEVVGSYRAGKEPDGLGYSAVAAAPAGLRSAVRYARLALDCVPREYPNKIAHVMNSDADALPPRKLTPAFFGCYDWHSSVHGHWLLARIARLEPGDPLAIPARAALGKSLTAANMAGEVAYLAGPGRGTFERPYGLAWLLQLAAELREWNDPEARAFSAALRPLEQAAATQLYGWLPKLAYPIREGEHAQTAFAFGLILDWARTAGEGEKAALLTRRILELYGSDAGCPLAYEPSGQDFLSPCLAEADLLRRVLSPAPFASWLGSFLPQVPSNATSDWLRPGVTTDASDGKLAHLDGLNLSRAFMLEGIAAGLPADDPRIASLRNAALVHRAAGLSAITGEHYEGGHWLGTFAVYGLTRRGLGADR
jgi:YVTN family beta-propeller protein